MGTLENADRPWQALCVDFVGPFPRSKSGFVYIFVVVDSFSKFVHIHPMRTATAKGIISFLEKAIFLVFGIPDHSQQEAANKTIGTAIRIYIKDNHREWDRFLPKIACAINTAAHSSTDSSPYYVNFGCYMVSRKHTQGTNRLRSKR